MNNNYEMILKEKEHIYNIVKEKREFKVKGDVIEVDFMKAYDKETGKYIRDKEITKINDDNIFGQYRKKHNLLFPEEIIKIREYYNITQSDLSLVLGWGGKTIARYERGSIQDKGNNSLLELIKDNVENFELLLEKNKDNLTLKKLEKYRKIIKEKKLNFKSKTEMKKYISITLTDKIEEIVQRDTIEFRSVLGAVLRNLKEKNIRIEENDFTVAFTKAFETEEEIVAKKISEDITSFMKSELAL